MSQKLKEEQEWKIKNIAQLTVYSQIKNEKIEEEEEALLENKFYIPI